MAEVDTNIYSPLMKPTNPYEQTNNLLDTVAKAQHVRANDIGIDAAKFELAMKNIGAVNSTIASLLGDPDAGRTDISKKIIDATTRLVKDNVYTAQHVTEALKEMPRDPVRQAQWLRNIYSQTQSAEQRANSFFGPVQGVPDQAGNRLIQAPGYPNLPAQERGYVPNQLPPTTPSVQGDPNQPNFGAGGYVGPAGRPGLQQGPGSAPRPIIGGGPAPISAAGAAVRGPAGGVAERPAAAPMSSLPPGQAEAAQRTGVASGEMLASERSRAANYRREIYPLEQAIPALERLGKTGTGPGTEQVNQIKSFLQSVGVPGIDVKKIKDYDEAHKYLTDWVTANGDSSTNDKLAAAFSSNASTKISNAAAVDVAKAALSLRKMKQAQLEEFQASGLPDDKYGKWASEWNRKQDPRVFGWDYMTDEQRKNMLRSATGAKRDQMIMQIHQAAESGLINPASLAPLGR